MDEKLNEILAITKDNNKILHGMRRAQRWSSFFNFVYYALIIGSVAASYYYLQPMIDSALKSYQGLMSGVQNAQGGLSGAGNLNLPPELLNQLKGILNI